MEQPSKSGHIPVTIAHFPYIFVGIILFFNGNERKIKISALTIRGDSFMFGLEADMV